MRKYPSGAVRVPPLGRIHFSFILATTASAPQRDTTQPAAQTPIKIG